MNGGLIDIMLGAAEARKAHEEGTEETAADPEVMKARRQQRAEELTDLHRSLMERNIFEPGNMVQWKPGLKNRKGTYNDVYVVIATLEEPLDDATEVSSSAYFKEPLDIVVGQLVDGMFAIFHYDSRRLEHADL